MLHRSSIIYFSLTMFLFMNSVAGTLHADQTLEAFDDPAKQALYLRLTKELRCLVCQNQNLADSNADLAKDLRQKTYQMVGQNKSYDEIVSFMVSRYGDFVLYRPPVKSITLLLWASPFFLILLLVFAVFRRKQSIDDQLDTVSRSQLDQAKKLIAKANQQA